MLKERVKALLDEKNIAPSALEKKANLPNGTIGKLLSGVTQSVGIQVIEKICSIYPDVDPGFLAFGVAPVVKDADTGIKAIPALDIQAAAGYPYNINNPAYVGQFPTVSITWPEFRRGNHMMIQTTGDSMEPTIYHGDWLICSQLFNPVEEIRDGHVHVLFTADNNVVCKRLINRLKTKGSITVQSDNPAYPTYIEKADNILQVFRVVYKFSPTLKNPNTDLYKRLNDLEHDMLDLKSLLKK